MVEDLCLGFAGGEKRVSTGEKRAREPALPALFAQRFPDVVGRAKDFFETYLKRRLPLRCLSGTPKCPPSWPLA